jgi:ABC-type dipeptide/oligopeptide/nickel transport system ATPase component
MPEGDALLVVENLKAYHTSKKGLVRAVDDVSFEIRKGECVGLLGESGCGKSSMALAIMGIFERIARYAAGSSNIPGLRKQFNKTVHEEEDRPGVRGHVYFKGIELTGLPEEEFTKIRGSQMSMANLHLG